jgi:hypothetical protein
VQAKELVHSGQDDCPEEAEKPGTESTGWRIVISWRHRSSNLWINTKRQLFNATNQAVYCVETHESSGAAASRLISPDSSSSVITPGCLLSADDQISGMSVGLVAASMFVDVILDKGMSLCIGSAIDEKWKELTVQIPLEDTLITTSGISL